MCDFTTNCETEGVLWAVSFPPAPVSYGRTIWACRDHVRDAASKACDAWYTEAVSNSDPEVREHAKRMIEDHRPLLDIIPETDFSAFGKALARAKGNYK